jgi:hypothetical protein
MLQVFYIDVAKGDRDVAHVAMVFLSICPKYFICFRHMLQLFHLDITKVNLDVAYTCMLQVYVLFSGVFIYMLQVFYLDVAYVFAMATNVCFLVFQTYVASISIVSDICCKCFI